MQGRAMKASILKAIAVTAELTGSEISEVALRVMTSDLDAYPEEAVLRALDRCRRELKTRLTLAAVLERIEEQDGRPGADEAWAIALGALDEAETVVWTDEMAQAFAVARPVLDARDKVGARVAFRDAYDRLVREAREAGQRCKWVASIGHDASRRDVALTRAVERGRITGASVAHLLAAPRGDTPVGAALLENRPGTLLNAPGLTDDEREANLRGLAMVRAHLADLDRMQAESRAIQKAQMREHDERARRRKTEMMAQVDALIRGDGGLSR
jgi:hypothetical protein